MNTQKLRDMNLHAVADELEQLRKFKAEVESQEPEPYDAGFLNDFGGGNVSWWHDYIRSELERAHDHYAQQFIAPADKPEPDDAPTQRLWDYYQDLLKHYGFDGITDLLVKYRKLVEQVPEVAAPAVQGGSGGVAVWRGMRGRRFAQRGERGA